MALQKLEGRRRGRMGGFVRLEALLVARVLLADGALDCGREDDEGVDFRGNEGRFEITMILVVDRVFVFLLWAP